MPTPASTVAAETPPLNAGVITSSVTRPITSGTATAAAENRTAPTTESANGPGCVRMKRHTKRAPRR